MEAGYLSRPPSRCETLQNNSRIMEAGYLSRPPSRCESPTTSAVTWDETGHVSEGCSQHHTNPGDTTDTDKSIPEAMSDSVDCEHCSAPATRPDPKPGVDRREPNNSNGFGPNTSPTSSAKLQPLEVKIKNIYVDNVEQQQAEEANPATTDLNTKLSSPTSTTSSSPKSGTSILEQPDNGAASDFQGQTDVIRRIPKPKYPVRVFNGPPQPFSFTDQQAVMHWKHEHCHFFPDPYWNLTPCTDNIMEVVWPFLSQLGAEEHNIKINFLVDGGFNRVYTIETTDRITKQRVDYIFRVALPVDPYYKTESDVATTVMVRHCTTIPVPTIYAYDSSTNNPLGLEWVLMERLDGERLTDLWCDLDYDCKFRITQTVARWTAQLSKFTSDKMGSIYMRDSGDDVEFYVGRLLYHLLSQEHRLRYEVFRGPFDSLEAYCSSVLAVSLMDVQEVKEAFQSGVQFENDGDSKGTFLDQHWSYYMDDDRKWRSDDEWRNRQQKELKLLSKGIEAIQRAFPSICDKARFFGPLTSFLSHHDLNLRNIFVSNDGAPLALLDWEYIQLVPCLQLTGPPKFLDTYERLEDPTPSEMSLRLDAETRARNNFTEEETAEQLKTNAEVLEEQLDEYHCTILRAEYLRELERLGSPLAKAIWEDFPELDREILEHVENLSRNAETHVKWVRRALGMSEDEDSEENEDEESDDEKIARYAIGGPQYERKW